MSVDEIILIMTAAAGAFASMMASIRLSKCVHISLCWDCLVIKRKLKSENAQDTESVSQV
jgi:hypothetical protein